MENTSKRLIMLLSLDMIFLVLMNIFSSLSGYLYEAMRIIAYLLPILLFVIFGEKSFGDTKITPDCFKLSKQYLPLLLFIFPTLLIIALVSALTSALLSLFLPTYATTLSGNLFLLILRNAIITAFLEELLFRLIPLKLIGDMGTLKYVSISAILFMLIHTPISMPYALVAGALFAYLSKRTGSILPSLIIHTLNNIFGVLLIYEGLGDRLSGIYIYALLALSVISLIIYFVLANLGKNVHKA